MAEEDLAKLLLVARKVRDYLVIVRGAFAFAVFAMAICGSMLVATGLLLAYPLSAELQEVVYGATYVVSVVLSFLILVYAAPRGPSMSSREKRELFIVPLLCFAVPYIITLLILYVGQMLGLYVEPLSYNAWFAGLGMALLLVHVMIERRYGMKPYPFLVAGTLMILQSPLVAMIAYRSLEASYLCAIGFVLLDYLVASTILLRKGKELLGT